MWIEKAIKVLNCLLQHNWLNGRATFKDSGNIIFFIAHYHVPVLNTQFGTSTDSTFLEEWPSPFLNFRFFTGCIKRWWPRYFCGYILSAVFSQHCRPTYIKLLLLTILLWIRSIPQNTGVLTRLLGMNRKNRLSLSGHTGSAVIWYSITASRQNAF